MKKIGEKIVLHVEGMTCNNCANGIKNHLEKNLIENVNVNFSLSEVSCNEDKTSNKKHIISLIEDIGYQVKNKNNKEKKFSKVEMLFCRHRD